MSAPPRATPELAPLLQRVLETTIELLQANKGIVHLHGPSNGTLEVAAQVGFEHGFLDGLASVDPQSLPWRTAFDQRVRIVVEDVLSDPRLEDTRGSYLQQGVRSFQSVPLLDSQGRRLGLLSIHRDRPHRPSARDLGLLDIFWLQAEQAIESKQSEEALRRNEAGLRLALEAGEMGSFEWNIQTGEIRWSDNLETIHGLPRGTFSGTFESFQSLIHPEDRARVLGHIRQCVETGADYEAEFRSSAHSSTAHWIMGKGKVLADDRGQPSRMMGVCMDITRRKNTEAAIRESERRKDEFLAMISHELRNPLSAITSASALLDQVALGNPLSSKACGVIRRQTEQLTRIVNDLLDISRLTTGKLVLHEAVLDLSALVDRCVREVKGASVDGHRHELRLTRTPVRGDSVRLEQVVTNLLTNAIKYTPADGTITVEVEPVGPEAVLRVRDTGIGIAPELLPRVFDLFVQSDQGVDRRAGGLGVGLSIVRGLVEAHGGRVEARSAGADRGAELVVRLPLATPPAERPEPAPREARSARSARRRILVIDDNVDARESLGTLLELAGHEVHQAEDGPSGLELVTRVRPDAVLVDIGLPGLDGFEVARQLRAGGSSLRLIALTGYGHPDDRRRGEEAGFDAYLVKPVELKSVLQALPGVESPPDGAV